MNQDRMAHGFIVVTAAAFFLCAVGTVAFVVVHFIAKFW